jgi:hypothetical protein
VESSVEEVVAWRINQPVAKVSQRSALQAKLGELAASLADNLEVHTAALDLGHENARNQRDVYETLARKHRAVAAQLEAVGNEMAAQRDLPMGRHDPAAMSSPRVREVFERYVTVEQEVLALLQERVEEDQSLLEELRSGR